MYKLGIITPVHITQERYDISLAWMSSMVTSLVYPDMSIKHIIIDDGSSDKAKELLVEYKETVKARIDVLIVTIPDAHSKWNLSRNFNEGLALARDCDYVISIPDDVLINKHLWGVIGKSLEYLDKPDIGALTFFKDARARIFGTGNKVGAFDKHFNYIDSCDGFILLAKTKVYDNIIRVHDPKKCKQLGSTCLWRGANEELVRAGLRILSYNESLAQHIGNSFSSMTQLPRKLDRYIYSKDVNLWKLPEILT